MKAIITGASGTVGTALRQHLLQNGHQVIAWNRHEIPIDDYYAMEHFVREQQADALFHLAVVSTPQGIANEDWLVTYEWTSELAWICRQLNIRFVFTSSVMVFTDDAIGPFTPDSQPDATSGYGYEKWQAEQRTHYQNPDAIVARLGWQIGDSAGSNNMMDYLEQQMRDHGEIRASRRWLPACSFVEDTASALMALLNETGGLYLVDANEKWSFYEIVTQLNGLHGNRWKVVADDAFVYDQRMIDARVPIASLKSHLPDLA